MDLPDNNVLISAFRPDAQNHSVAKQWLEDSLNGGNPIRLFPTVEAGFLRVVTHPKIFSPPTPFSEAWEFLSVVRSSPVVEICPWTPGARERWGDLCASLGLIGNDCNDAMLAATATDRGLRLVTFDKGFHRFPGLSLLLLPG
jgi:uncharacterized protein